MLVTDWVCAAVSGATVDKREIKESVIEEAASSYSQTVYNARVWLEHLRGVLPDGFFKAMGDVVAVKAERIKSGSLAGRLALFVRIAPQPDLVSLVRSGQKVHLSIELVERFADTGKAYLVGLGVTDSPASLGTGIMKFNMESRGENIFSVPQPVEITLPSSSFMASDSSVGSGFAAPSGGYSSFNVDALKYAVLDALRPALDRIESQYKAVSAKQDELLDTFTPEEGNKPRREPHNGGFGACVQAKY